VWQAGDSAFLDALVKRENDAVELENKHRLALRKKPFATAPAGFVRDTVVMLRRSVIRHRARMFMFRKLVHSQDSFLYLALAVGLVSVLCLVAARPAARCPPAGLPALGASA
jgi:hypothetical protein